MDEEKLVAELEKGSVSVLAKPNAKVTEVIGFDEVREAWRIAIAAQAKDDKANIELIRFISKIAKKRVKIKSGLKSKQKLIVFA